MAAIPTVSDTAGQPVALADLSMASATGAPESAGMDVDLAGPSTASKPAGTHVVPAVQKPPKPAKIHVDKRRWTTPAQQQWLLAQFPDYLEAQSKGRYEKFWPDFFRDWFAKFPPRKPTDDDSSDIEVESDDDIISDVEDPDDASDNVGASTKRKRGTSKPKKKNKKKKPVSILFSSCIFTTEFQYRIFFRICQRLSRRLRERKA